MLFLSLPVHSLTASLPHSLTPLTRSRLLTHTMTTPTLLFKRGKSLYSNSALCATRHHVHSLSSRVKQCGSSFNTQRKWFSTKKRILPSTTLLGSLNSISSDTYRNSHSTTHSTTHSLTTYGYTTSLNSRLFSTFSLNAVGSSSSTITPSTTHTHTHTHIHNTSILKEPITKVTTVTQAQQVLQVLYANPDVYWACDTEVADIDVKNVGKHVHTYIHTYIHTYLHTYIHTYMHTYIHTHIRTYIHTSTHTRIHYDVLT